MKKVFLTVLSVLLIGVGIGTESTTWADGVGPGFDIFFSIPGIFTPGTAMIIPPGTISPDQTSEVFVPLMGVPIGPGTTDTIVERKSGVGGPGEPAFGEPIDIELVALSLMSVSPVTIPGVPGGPFTVGVVEDPAVESLGTMTISHETPDGGTFTSVLEVNSLVTLTPPSGPVLGPVPRVDTLSGGGTWSHAAPAGFPSSPFPSGGFFAGATSEFGMLAAHFTQPPRDGVPVPEPSLLLLLGAAVTALGVAARRRRRRRS